MAQVYVCDICGKVNPPSIRRIIAENPDVKPNTKINSEKYYAFNTFSGDFCNGCLHEIEKAIRLKIHEMEEESKNERMDTLSGREQDE